MNYLKHPKYHYKPKKGWINDPNGLVYFKGYYHVFYQHLPNSEVPFKESMCWGHARTKDFLFWQELPVALKPDTWYDNEGCWSGTSIVVGERLYVFYTSVTSKENRFNRNQTVSLAYSDDGINFFKYENNPVIVRQTNDGSDDFRDPAVVYKDGKFYVAIATGHPETKTARLLLYESDNVTDWQYKGIIKSWENKLFAECPSFVKTNDKYILSSSVPESVENHMFTIMYGNFKDGVFAEDISGCNEKGPDGYAGQIFCDHLGRNILISWLPGWGYHDGFASKDIGCLSVPKEITVKDNKIYVYPVEEVQHLLKNSDHLVEVCEDGFKVERNGRESVIHNGKINDIKILKDNYIMEIFVNGGENVYSILL
jgi:beta-fructofuranosidase